ncbi:MAG TPA: adenylate/guanylate cyclase domain-containing protein [Pyrinomonadaceae bacterium]|nr:adenylate/guanylate cyclase domain-containing protein [Pyrinomonadaceae bacterium]
MTADTPSTTGGEPSADAARARTALLAHIRHELSAPINAIIGYGEMLIEGAGGGDAVAQSSRDDLQKILTAGQQLRTRVGDLLNPARAAAPDLDLDAFGSHVRHELRTPINAVIGYSEMLIEDAGEPDESEFVADLQKIHAAGRELLELIEDIVRFSDLEANSDNLCAPNAGVSSMIANLVSTIHAIDDAHARHAEQGGLVLVVDDSETNRDILARRLKREGYEVECASDGTQALASVESRKFDLVLLDIMMPGLNGYQVLERLKASPELHDIPVIMISALGEIDSIVRCIEMGAEDYLPKPFNPVILRARVEASLEKKRLRDREQAYLAQLRIEREKSERLLLNILPAAIAERLKEDQGIIAESFTEATILFADVVGFTQMSAQITPVELVYLLNEIFSAFDELAARHGLEKIKTIGDAYMVAAGLPERRADHAEAMAEMALDMQDALATFNRARSASLNIRTGINTGPVVAGIIGSSKFIYDLWGDAVNTASRMESHSTPGRIQVTASTYERLRDQYLFEARGTINVKGKGDMPTYFLLGRK